jgi:hypothetical protein
MRIFGQLLLVDKQKVPYLYKTTSKEFLKILHKNFASKNFAQMLRNCRWYGNNDVSRWRILRL